METENITH